MTGNKDTERKSNKKEKNNRLSGIAAFSLLIALFDRLGEAVYNAFINGFFGRIFTSYTPLRTKISNGFFGTYVFKNGRIRRFFRKIRAFLARNIESCVTVSLTTKAIDKLCAFPLQYYGNYGLFFGIYTIVIYYVKQFIPWLDAAPSSHLLVGIIIAVTSVPLVFSRVNLATTVKNSVFGRAVFKHTFGFSDEIFDNKKTTSRGKGNLMLFLGLISGIATLFIHPLYIIITIFSIVVITLIAVTPEIGVLLTIAILPFLSFSNAPTIYLSLMILVTTFFYIIKLIRGKRVFKLEILDFMILLFGIMILLSSIYSAGGKNSFYSALVSVILLLGYFLFVNLMRTEKWVQRCIIALVTSASVVAMIGIFEFVFGKENNNWLDQSFHSIIKTRVVSLLENPNMLGLFLVSVFPFLLALLVKSKDKNSKFLVKTLIVLFVVCITVTWSRAAWLAVILGALIFAMMYTKKSFRFFGIALLAIPIIPIILPSSVIERFLSISNLADSSIAYRIYTWKGTLSALKVYFFSGIGYGDSAFQNVYPTYSYSGIEATPHSHSLIFQLLLCMGIVGFTVFCIAIFLSIQKNLEFIKNQKQNSSSVYVIASITSVISALIVGVFDYIWYNPRIFYLFWITLAIGVAIVRVGNFERTRLEAYEHDQSL